MKRLPVPRERDVQAAVMDALASLGLKPERANTGVGTFQGANGKTRRVRFGTPGQGDIRLVLPDGRACEIEVKRPGKRPTRLQRDRMQRINASNGVALWVTDAEQILRVMPLILKGAWIEMDERGDTYVTDEGRDS